MKTGIVILSTVLFALSSQAAQLSDSDCRNCQDSTLCKCSESSKAFRQYAGLPGDSKVVCTVCGCGTEKCDTPPCENKSGKVSLRTNLLYDAALLPNLALEIGLGKGWTITAEGFFAWWSKTEKNLFWRIYGGEMNLRHYFGRNYTGHHVGAYGQALSYDIELRHTGNLSDFSWGAGIDYGYSLPVGKKLSIDFSLGIGYFTGDYKSYEPENGKFVWKKTSRRQWIGPTKAEVGLVWHIYGSNRKGGRK